MVSQRSVILTAAASVGPEVGKLSLHHPQATLDPGHRTTKNIKALNLIQNAMPKISVKWEEIFDIILCFIKGKVSNAV